MEKKEILKKIENQILVSCQAKGNNPLANIEDMIKMAKCAELGGCAGFRVNHPDYVRAIREATNPDMIVIGIWKMYSSDSSVYITPRMQAVDALVEAGADIIALDCTDRINSFGKKGYDLVKEIKRKYPNQVIMADCATYEDAVKSKEVGVDIVSTTLAGYTDETRERFSDNPDFELIKEMSAIENIHVVAEGRIWTQEDVEKTFLSGANTLVIGTAITNPMAITARFVKTKNDYFK